MNNAETAAIFPEMSAPNDAFITKFGLIFPPPATSY